MLNVRRRGLLFASGVWLAIYVACALLVTSFIFFEVLDVDGSDFPTHPAQMAARLADPQHDDLKRMGLQGPVRIWTGPSTALEPRPTVRSGLDVPVVVLPAKPLREPRVALPRAALSDAAPPA